MNSEPGQDGLFTEPGLPPVMFFALDADGVVTLSEGPGLAQLGLSPAQLVGVSVREWYADYPVVLKNLDRVLSGERVREVVELDEIQLDTYLEPRLGPHGEVVGAFGTSIDVTETRRHARYLADLARRNRALSALSAHLAEDTGDVELVLRDAAQIVAEALGGYAVVWTATENGGLTLGVYWHNDPQKRDRIPEWLSRAGGPETAQVLASAAVNQGRIDAIGIDELLTLLPPDAHQVRAEAGATEVAHAPIRARGEMLGVLGSYREPEHGAFTHEELSLMGEFAARIGMALANARLVEELRATNAELVRAEEHTRRLAEQRQALLARQVAAVEAERARIAADVHDDSIQVLAAVDLRLGLLRRRLKREAPAHVDLLDRLQGDIQDAISRLRALLFDLESPAREHPLGDALRQLAARTFADPGIDWVVDDVGSVEPAEALRTIAYRVCQEALANVRRHADASRVTIRVACVDGGLVVQVTDDGRGMGPDAMEPRVGHLGLAGMRERAEAAGGHCTIDSRPGAGTTVTTWLPLDDVAGTTGSNASDPSRAAPHADPSR